MLMRIIEAHARGESARSIAKWLLPPVSESAVQKYLQKHVKPAIALAARLEAEQNAKEAENASVYDHGLPSLASNEPNPTVRQVAMATLVGKRSLAIRENRIAVQADLVRRLGMVIDERAAEMSVCEVCGRDEELHPIGDDSGSGRRCDRFVRIAGGASGLIARDIKGPNDTPIYKVDTGLTGELRELMKHTAIELGQWQENIGGNVSIQVICPITPSAETAPRIVIGAEGTIEANPEDYEDIGVIQGR